MDGRPNVSSGRLSDAQRKMPPRRLATGSHPASRRRVAIRALRNPTEQTQTIVVPAVGVWAASTALAETPCGTRTDPRICDTAYSASSRTSRRGVGAPAVSRACNTDAVISGFAGKADAIAVSQSARVAVSAKGSNWSAIVRYYYIAIREVGVASDGLWMPLVSVQFLSLPKSMETSIEINEFFKIWGTGGRGFESRRSDQIDKTKEGPGDLSPGPLLWKLCTVDGEPPRDCRRLFRLSPAARFCSLSVA